MLDWLAAGVSVSVTVNMTGTEVDTNGQIWSLKKTRTHATCPLAADEMWEDCNPVRSHREEKAVESLDSRAKAKKQRDGWSSGAKQALPGTSASRLMPSDGGKKEESDSIQRELFKRQCRWRRRKEAESEARESGKGVRKEMRCTVKKSKKL